MKITSIHLVLLLSLALAFSACKKDDFEGEMEIAMTDSPGNYASLKVELTKVEIEGPDNAWITLNDEARIYTVTDLTNGTTATIANQASLSAGAYSKVRLTIGSRSSIRASLGGPELNFASITRTSVEIPVNVEVSAEARTRILLDFNVGESVGEVLGAFNLDPTLTWIQNENTGVSGSLEASAKAYLEFSRDSGSQSYSCYSDDNGRFKVIGMASGTYTATISPRDGQGFASATTVTNVTVQDGNITALGTIDLQ